MSATRKYYILSALIFAVGAVLAAAKQQPVALAIFVGLLLMMLWIQSRVDRIVEERHPDRSSSTDD